MFQKPTFNATKLPFKDEGGFYTTKLTKDGKPIDPFALYEYGSLKEVTAATRKQAKQIAKDMGLTATFDY